MPVTPKPAAPIDHTASAVRTVGAEIEGLKALAEGLEGALRAPFAAALAAVAAATGRVVVTGMGKSGHIARKVAATLASTGTPAFFLHPAEASHGDLGMVAQGDVVLALSWSGETPELRDVIHYCKRFAIPLIAIASEGSSALAGAADVALVLPKAEEACPNQLAPTTSTTMQLALGDALAMALLEARGFSAADFREFHPGGRLGTRLVTVGELMGKGEAVPSITEGATLADAIHEISRKRYGGAAVVDGEGRITGAFTDGDLRRALPVAGLEARVGDHMTRTPVTVDPHMLATEALRVMNERERPIMLLFVCEQGRLVGALHMHDLLRAGIA
ncbi:MAG TPA: KpsF/GutQ family sugar-phosphate isomerase [Caulobacteraceae bacterium]|nr:KpsF/GutQ family sugar-phosphate isomerase [Caulobacteraceae bacterium]